METEKYKNQMEYPKAPNKPTLIGLAGKTITPVDYRKHADALEVYEKELAAHKEKQREYNEETGRLTDLFVNDLFEELGITNHPKRHALYSIAYEQGHAYGMGEVAIHAQQLVPLLEYTPEELKILNKIYNV